MRAFLVAVLAILILAAVGWISFTNSPDKASVNVEKTEIQTDTQRAIESGQQLVNEAGEAVDQAVTSDEEELPPTVQQQPAPETATQPPAEPTETR